MNDKVSVLPEMFIKSESSADFEPFHDSKRSAIGKAECFVFILLKDSPCAGDILVRYFDYIGGCGIKLLLAELNCLTVAKALADQIQGFNNDEISSCYRRFVCLNEEKGAWMKSIILILKGIISGRVNKDCWATYFLPQGLP